MAGSHRKMRTLGTSLAMEDPREVDEPESHARSGARRGFEVREAAVAAVLLARSREDRGPYCEKEPRGNRLLAWEGKPRDEPGGGSKSESGTK